MIYKVDMSKEADTVRSTFGTTVVRWIQRICIQWFSSCM